MMSEMVEGVRRMEIGPGYRPHVISVVMYSHTALGGRSGGISWYSHLYCKV